MGNEIRIDDLAAPVLNDIQKMGIDYGEKVHTELTVDAICEAAIAATGLSDFGPEDFRERLQVQLDSINADPELLQSPRSCWSRSIGIAAAR